MKQINDKQRMKVETKFRKTLGECVLNDREMGVRREKSFRNTRQLTRVGVNDLEASKSEMAFALGRIPFT